MGPDPLIMQASRGGNYVYIQPGWVGQAAMDFENRENSEYESYYDIHIALGVIKLLHEFVYCLTHIILEAEYSLRRSRNSLAQRLEDTPIKMGFTSVKKGERRKGDIGFAAEELMSGGYRFYPRFHDSPVPYKFIGFHVYKLVEETLTGGKFAPYEVENEEDIVKAVVSGASGFDILTDFYVRPQPKNVKKRKAGVELERKGYGRLFFPEDVEEDEEDEEDWEKAFEGQKPYIVSNRDDNRVE